MSKWRLLKVTGVQDREEWPLSPMAEVVVGRSDPPESPLRAQDVDLWPDYKVSRLHARLTFAGGRWLIQDDDSTNNTHVGATAIKKLGPVGLEPGTVIRVGDTELLVASENWHRVRRGSVVVDLEAAPALNYSLTHCGAPIVSRIVVRNWAEAASRPMTVSLSIPGLGRTGELDVPPLPAGASHGFDRPHMSLSLESLEAQRERRKANLRVTLDGSAIGDGVPVWVLAHNEWSHAREHWLALSSFVLPNHPLVEQLTSDARQYLQGAGAAEDVFASLYDHLANTWSLAYVREPPHPDSDSQKLRLPHQVLANLDDRTGQGTCIDVALLLAACLEQAGLQALIAILDVGERRHSLVGCRCHLGGSLEPLVVDRARLLDGIIWAEPTGCTVADGVRLDFRRACRAAQKSLEEGSLLFALDLAAARQCGVRPLPFAGEPQWSPTVSAALGRAKQLAREMGFGDADTVHLLLGLLSIEGGLTQQLLRECGVMPCDAQCRILEDLAHSGAGGRVRGRPTPLYDQVLAGGRALAKRAGSPVVTERHLLTALLSVQSRALASALTEIGLAADTLTEALRAICAPEPSRTRSHSVFVEFSSRPSTFE